MIVLSRLLQQVLRSGRLLQAFTVIALASAILHWWFLGSYYPSSLRKQTPSRERLAFATLLLETNSTGSEYLTSTRMLNYQLRYAKLTRFSRPIPFLVLVTHDVPAWKISQLESEGVTVIPVGKLGLTWMDPLHERWRDVMIKLRLFQLLEYDRILFLDADTFLLSSLEGVFDDPAAQPQKTLSVAKVEEDEVELPATYLFSTLPEALHKVHSYPAMTKPYFNAGFFMLAPSTALFNYYVSLLNIPGKFDSTYPEQNLLNYAHRENGNMPWGRLGYWWNINLPNMEDVEGGVKSVHSKLWAEGNVLQPTEPQLRERWRSVKEEMERFYGPVE
jgi:alpha-N-acetylglucosamine transferase